MFKKIIIGAIILLAINRITGMDNPVKEHSSVPIFNSTTIKDSEPIIYNPNITISKTDDVFKFNSKEEVFIINTKMLKRKIFKTIKFVKDGMSNVIDDFNNYHNND